MDDSRSHLTFGLIADVQYADTEDGANHDRTRKRYYRSALLLLKRAVSHWKTSHPDLAFVLQLGDLIDGCNKNLGEDAVISAFEAAMVPFRDLSCPTYHTTGNHDFYNFTRKQCMDSELNSSVLPHAQGVEGELYYSVVVHSRLKVVVLDSYEVSVLGYNPDHPNYKAAMAVLEKYNPNEEKNSVAGLKGHLLRYAAFNGGITKKQLDWLDSQLTDAEQNQQNVLLCGHTQLVCLEGSEFCAVWNYQDVLDVIHSHSCVVVCVAGHDHDGSLTKDSAGLYHLVLNGVVETLPDTNAYATAVLHDTTLEIRGSGVVPSITVPLKYHI